MQHRGTLAHTQAREQHHMPVREFQRVVMGHGVVHVDLPEAREPLSDFLARENAEAERRLAFDILVERNLGARQQTDRNMRFSDRAKPRVMELLNLVVTSLSSIWAGRFAPELRHPYQQRPVTAAQSRTKRRMPQGDAELMTEKQVLGFKPAPLFRWGA